MSIFFQRVALFLFFIVLERSFVSVLWPAIGTPVVIVALIASLVFALGFERGLLWSLLLVFGYEALGATGSSWFPLYAVGVAYATSFLSRRFLIEHRARGVLILGAEVALFSLGYTLLSTLGYGLPWSFAALCLAALVSFSIFLVVFPFIQWWERRIEMGQMTEFRGLRT